MSRPDQQDLNDLERALAGLRPSAAPFNRDRLLFEAGRSTVRRRWLWPATSVLTSALAASLGLLLLLHPAPPAEVRIVYVDRPVIAPQTKPVEEPREAPPPAAAPLAQWSVWRMERDLMHHDIDDVPAPAVTPAAPTAGVVLSAWDWRPRPSAILPRFDSGVE